MLEEGILRISGETSRAEDLILEYEQGNRPNLEREYIHTVSTLMKKYFNKMPDPLLTFNMYQDWVSLYGIYCTNFLLHFK